MTRRLTSVLALTAALLAFAPAASAKGPISITICGESACRELDAMRPRNQAFVWGLVNAYQSPASRSAPPLAPYYRIEMEGWDWAQMLYLPDAGLEGSDAGWQATDAATNTALKRATRGLAPFPAPVPSRVRANGVAVDDPAAYAALFGTLRSGQAVLDRPPVRISMSGVPVEWLGDARPIEYFPDAKVVRIGREWLRASDEIAALIDADLAPAAPSLSSFPSPSPSPSRGFPWAAAVGLAALIGAAGWAGWMLVRARALRHA